LNNFICPFQMNSVASRCYKCFQHNFPLGHLLGALNYGWPIGPIFPFIQSFYVAQFLLFFNHHSPLGNFTIIHSSMGTWYEDWLERSIFPLVRFLALCNSIGIFPSCLFPLIVDGIHIIGHTSMVPCVFEHFAS
jgi:hypothetical protein